MEKNMKVNTVTCPVCNTTLFSRSRHDFRSCGCEFQTFVDGGFDYFRYGGKDLSQITRGEMEINATKQELYDDWNYSMDVFGKVNYPKG
jgi:hypothetical protein